MVTIWKMCVIFILVLWWECVVGLRNMRPVPLPHRLCVCVCVWLFDHMICVLCGNNFVVCFCVKHCLETNKTSELISITISWMRITFCVLLEMWNTKLLAFKKKSHEKETIKLYWKIYAILERMCVTWYMTWYPFMLDLRLFSENITKIFASSAENLSIDWISVAFNFEMQCHYMDISTFNNNNNRLTLTSIVSVYWMCHCFLIFGTF